jgi:ABC-2 type transport system permease protein
MRNGIRPGFTRGRLEIRQAVISPSELWTYLNPALVLLVTLIFMRGSEVPGTDVALGASTLPGLMGLAIGFAGILTVAQLLVVDREDGTLLRAKATPDGMVGYLIGKVVLVGGMTVVTLLVQVVIALFLTDVWLSLDGLVTALWLLPLAFLATVPLGAVFGSVFENPRGIVLLTLPLYALVAISGIFYPITSVPGWLQGVAQVFPLYWLGLGARSALLPDELAAVELGDSWRHLETAGVLGAWAVLGIVLAPIVLRRMARRESGSVVAVRRERALARSSM